MYAAAVICTLSSNSRLSVSGLAPPPNVMSVHSFRKLQTDQTPSGNPLRQHSTASTSSSAYSYISDPSILSRTSTISSAASSAYSQAQVGHKRGLSEATSMSPSRGGYGSVDPSPDQFYRSARQSLRPLPQAPASSPPAKRHSPHHVRSKTADRFASDNSEDSVRDKNEHNIAQIGRVWPHIQHVHSSPHGPPLASPDLQELQKSSTGHLRALSKFAQKKQTKT